MTLPNLLAGVGNGNGLMADGGGILAPSVGPPPLPIPTPRQIMALVDNQERYTDSLRQRMEEDWDLLTLKAFDAGKGYQEYTSNEPMTYFAKMTSSLSSGKLKIRIPVARAQRNQREQEADAERFYVGIFTANDERLLRLGQPVLQDSLASFINLRGWYCGRCMLVKDPDTGEVYADITPWDPLHVFWEMGSKGLKWACHKAQKTVAEVLGEYPNWRGSNGYTPDDYFAVSDKTVDVYDWYDEENNMVVIESEFAKPPTPHTSVRRVPVFFGSVGSLPLIRSRTGDAKINLKHYGESIYAANRRIYGKLNLVFSTMLQLVALSRDQAFYITGGDGTKELDKNPHLAGSQFSLPEGYTFNVVNLLEMSKDTGAFLGLVSGEIQRGALPYSVYGQLAFQLSGYAVKLLKQATDSPTMPRQRAMENAFWQCATEIGDQFATGVYGTMRLQGRGRNRNFFDEEFTPEMIRGLPSLEVELKVHTPQDDLQQMQLAKMASDGAWPILSMRHILDEILDIQDTDSMSDEIKEEVAEKMVPAASLMTMYNTLQRQGRGDLVPIYEWELWKQAVMGGLNPSGATGGAVPGKNGGGVSPQNLSAPEQGAPTPQPTPQQGPNVPPASPRPGASAPQP